MPLISNPNPGAVRWLPLVWDVLCLLAVYCFALAIVRSVLMVQSPQLLGTAVFLDLVITTAVCHWLLGVRLGGLPAWTVLPLAGVGVTAGHFMLPASVVEHGALPLALAAVVEGAALLLVALRVRTVAAGFRAARRSGADVFAAFEAGLLSLGAYAAPVARWARLELEVWFFAFTGWFSHARVPVGASGFSHHREVGWSAIAAVLVLLVMIEGTLVHLGLDSAGLPRVKWLVFAAHSYGLIWLLGDAHALRLRRTLVSAGAAPSLEVRVGVRAHGRFSVSEISELSTGTWDSAEPGEQLLSISGPANLRIAFRQEQQLALALRAPVPLRGLLLQVDEPVLLAAEIRAQMQRLAGARRD